MRTPFLIAGLGCFTSVALAQWPSEVLLPLPNGWAAVDAEIHGGDFNLDGRLDILYANQSDGTVQWLENNSAGTWLGHPIANLGQNFREASVLDVNRDGRLDIVATWFVAGQGGDSFAWFENPGVGSAWTQHPLSLFSFALTKAMTVFDIDGDGFEDLLLSAVDDLGFQNHMAYRNTGTALDFVANVAIHDQATVAAPGDYDGDGDSDVAFTLFGFPFPGWRANNSLAGSVAFGAQSAAPNCQAVQAIDYDQDGDDDMLCQLPVLGVPGTSSLAWSESVGGVMSAPQANPSLPTGGIIQRSMETCDLDGDGDLDMVLYFRANGLPNVGTLENLGGGLLGPLVPVSPNTMTAAPLGRIVGDFDGDGDLDIVVGWNDVSTTDSLTLFKNPEVFGSNLTCTSLPNSTGAVASLSVTGSNTVAVNQTHLVAEELPVATFTMFLAATGEIPGFTPAGSSGILCLGGSIGRYNAAGQLQVSDANGRAILAVNLNQVPQPSGPVMVLVGQTFYFQAWYRDIVAGQQTSNFSSAQSVLFQ